jgi:hypothetical protein
VIRPLKDLGIELRFRSNGQLYFSQIYRNGDELLEAAHEKRRELEAKGWHSS